MHLNMGCGHNKIPGYINVDMSPECQPDVVCNLEVLPWIWEDNSVSRVLFNHSLEHLGQDKSVFLGMFKELYRVCRNGAVIEINVPHPRHDNFINDPTHVRAITPQLLSLFDRQLNDEWKRTHAANSPLAHYLGVDFHTMDSTIILDEPYRSLFSSGKVSHQEMGTMLRERNNIASEYRMKMVVRK